MSIQSLVAEGGASLERYVARAPFAPWVVEWGVRGTLSTTGSR